MYSTRCARLAQLVEHYIDIVEVTGSIPVPRTKKTPFRGVFLCAVRRCQCTFCAGIEDLSYIFECKDIRKFERCTEPVRFESNVIGDLLHHFTLTFCQTNPAGFAILQSLYERFHRHEDSLFGPLLFHSARQCSSRLVRNR